MDIKELLALGAEKIRRNGTHLEQFSREYEKAFNSRPNCTGCTFKNNYRKLYNHTFNNNLINNKTMENHVIHKRQRNVIHTYVNKNGKSRRSYGKNMTDDFAENFLSRGTEAELEARRKLFVEIPGDVKEVKEVALKDLKFGELKKLYPEAEGNSQKKVLAWIEEAAKEEAAKEEAAKEEAAKEEAAKEKAKAETPKDDEDLSN